MLVFGFLAKLKYLGIMFCMVFSMVLRLTGLIMVGVTIFVTLGVYVVLYTVETADSSFHQ